jgi:hypothetical protein
MSKPDFICERCGGSTKGQDVLYACHRYYTDCFAFLKARIAALEAAVAATDERRTA